jgi:hypothetical protein
VTPSQTFSESCLIRNIGGRRLCTRSGATRCDGTTHAARRESRSNIWPPGAADVRDLARPFMLPTDTPTRVLVESRAADARTIELEREYGISLQGYRPLRESEADKNHRVLAEAKAMDVTAAHRTIAAILDRNTVDLTAAHRLVAERLARR